MDGLAQRSDRFERELMPDRIAAPAAGSLLLHAALFGGLFLYGILNGFFHHNLWGNPGAGGAIQVSLVSNALPLPSDQPRNDNVLTTETPSQAPAAPTPKATQAIDETAIPISGKQEKIKQETARKTQQHQPQPKEDNHAQFGEQAGTSIPRSTMAQNTASNGPVSISSGNFGNLFGYYILGIQRVMNANWYKPEVDPKTPKGTRAYIQFTIHRDGSVSDVRLDQPSASPTLDRSCIRAAQRVDKFDVLPAQYNQSTVLTSYYCEY
jgi:protein TonB